MFKKILFGTCLTEYCDHIFNFALNLAKENDAKLWIYHGLGRLNVSAEKVEEAINEAEAHTKELYVERMKKKATITGPSLSKGGGAYYDYSMVLQIREEKNYGNDAKNKKTIVA